MDQIQKDKKMWNQVKINQKDLKMKYLNLINHNRTKIHHKEMTYQLTSNLIQKLLQMIWMDLVLNKS